MNYSLANYKEIYEILEKNKGVIESEYIEKIFYAFQVASGQEYFKSRMKAIMDYFTKYSFISIKYSNSQVDLQTIHELEKCFQAFDSEFDLEILK
jgi:Ca2+-binding EF-hand superfamily protein